MFSSQSFHYFREKTKGAYYFLLTWYMIGKGGKLQLLLHMYMANQLFSKKFIIPLIVFTFLLPSCSKQSAQKPAPQQESAQTEQQQDKIPDQLKALEDNIEKVIKMLDGPAVTKQEGDSKGGAQKNTPKPQQEQNKPQGTQDQQGTQQKQAQQPDPWEGVTSLVNTMHYEWNSYMPSAAKSGVSKAVIENFSTALNGLTTAVISKNKINSLVASNSLYASIPDFYALYRTKVSPEIKRIRYYIRSAVLNSVTGNWNQADTDINNLKATWSLYKNAVSKDQQEIAGKLDFSIFELEKVIKEKNQILSDIKGRVALSNIEAMEKSLEESSKK